MVNGIPYNEYMRDYMKEYMKDKRLNIPPGVVPEYKKISPETIVKILNQQNIGLSKRALCRNHNLTIQKLRYVLANWEKRDDADEIRLRLDTSS